MNKLLMERLKPYIKGTLYYVRTIKGVGKIYQQTFLNTYSKVAFTKFYDRKNVLVATVMLKKVLPIFEADGIPMLRILTDKDNEYCC